MQVDFTARQVVITPALRKQAQDGVERITRILGRLTSAEVVLAAEKHRQKADLTVKIRQQTIVGTGEAGTLSAALRAAIERAESQAVRHIEKKRTRKRMPKEEKAVVEEVVARPPRPAVRNSASEPPKAKLRKPGEVRAVLVHSFPAKKPIPEPHVIRSIDAFALRPMSLEEAVKEAEFRDKDVFVFRDAEGNLRILHRMRDGKMELIEVPA